MSGSLAGWAAQKVSAKAADSRIANSLGDFATNMRDKISNSGPIQTITGSGVYRGGKEAFRAFATTGLVSAALADRQRIGSIVRVLNGLTSFLSGVQSGSMYDYNPRDPRYPGREQLLKKDAFQQQFDPHGEFQRRGDEIIGEYAQQTDDPMFITIKDILDQAAGITQEPPQLAKEEREMGAR